MGDRLQYTTEVEMAVFTMRMGPKQRESLDQLADSMWVSRGEAIRRFLEGEMPDAVYRELAFSAMSPQDKIRAALDEMDAERAKAEGKHDELPADR